MAIVQRGNKQLRVLDDAVDKYVADGYDALDSSGKVIKSAINAMIKQDEHDKIVNALKQELDTLKQESDELRNALEAAKKAKESKSKKEAE